MYIGWLYRQQLTIGLAMVGVYTISILSLSTIPLVGGGSKGREGGVGGIFVVVNVVLF